jgi:hypothetical protein
MAVTLPALPPPPPLSATPTADEHDRYMRYVAEVRYRADFESLWAWRERDLVLREASRANAAAHAQAQADTAVAMAGMIASQEHLAQTLNLPVLQPTPTDEELVRRFMDRLAEAGVTGAMALSQALDNLRVLKVKYPPAPPSVSAPV